MSIVLQLKYKEIVENILISNSLWLNCLWWRNN